MTWIKSHWKALALILALVLWAAWYSLPVDAYGLGIGELEAINVRVSCNEPGIGEQRARSIGLRPGDPLWQTVLEELEGLRLRRPHGIWSGSIKAASSAPNPPQGRLWSSISGTAATETSCSS